jgi:hypothetical protein
MVISFAVLWQHVFQLVVCVLSVVQPATQSHAVRHSVHTPQREIHVATTLQNLMYF